MTEDLQTAPCPEVKDYGPDATEAVIAHMSACFEYLHDEGPEPENMAGPFDGCEVCETREALHAAYPHLLKQVYANLAYDLRDLTNQDRPRTGVDSLFAQWLDEKIKEIDTA